MQPPVDFCGRIGDQAGLWSRGLHLLGRSGLDDVMAACECGFLCGVSLLFGGIATAIDGVYTLVDTILPPILFGGAAGVPIWLLLLDLRKARSVRAGLRAAIADARTEFVSRPWQRLRDLALIVGYEIFFGSLFLASVGVDTWWRT